MEEERRCSRSGKYRDITFLGHVRKEIERILDRRIRKRKSVEMEISEEQQAFRKGRATTDWMFTLRQLVHKRLEVEVVLAMVWTWRRPITLF